LGFQRGRGGEGKKEGRVGEREEREGEKRGGRKESEMRRRRNSIIFYDLVLDKGLRGGNSDLHLLMNR
jgi:hypothetical protein